ncbi:MULTISPECIES: HypC/HybG/HupF family hydrogenase formation chaperone [Vibrio]|uniref:NiFe-hydrogenase chaperone n=1 Tax=Vibrio halioticoli NBRC 102217 TaxID=1219072 RepID=V5FDD8_9VIBR|nr:MULTISPECIES: HypC/HybG/HupF family hydrogenase formation chaperone [Vibrio]MPW35777.1 HypC/HybG/HupF family hydrogenase formation chaperone [Vibrio sp. B1Z05]GAD89613.1 NiFe-hydrogenase chaperone [Vibrio halioticoli NBRC 102217]
MCFSIPSKITTLDETNQRAVVDTLGTAREVDTHLISEPIAVGDYVLIQSGRAVQTMPEQAALESLELYQIIFDKMQSGEI